MATNFPNSLDSLTNPATTDQLNSPSHAAQHANANDAIEQLQAKVGVNSSAVTTSHDYKIAQLEAAITAGVSGTKLIYQDVRNQSGVSLTKGTPVRVTGSDGASGKLLIGAASNSSEGGSSKTFGLLSSTLSNNSNGQVVTNGLLEGVDTTGAVDGDPVWLGVNGAKIFGLVNKPVAPAHLVYLGVVVRGGQQNTGSIFVSIQNGFEVDELHNVLINNTTLQNKDALVYDSTTQLWKNYDLSQDFVLSGDLQNSLGDYIPLNALGQPSGAASLDADGNLIVPENKIIIEGATADANELTIQAPDVESDITVTLPNATGTLALTSDISTAISNLIDAAPAALDTLNELAAAINDDASFASTVTTALASKAPLANPTFTGTVSGITKSMVGLGNVDNTTDANKPISTATQNALDLKVNSINPSFTVSGSPISFSPTYGALIPQAGGPSSLLVQFSTSLTQYPTNYFAGANLILNISGAYSPTHPYYGINGQYYILSHFSQGDSELFQLVDFTEPYNEIMGSISYTPGSLIIEYIDPKTISATEVGYLDGVTSGIQTQLDAKLSSSTASATYAPLASPALTGTPTAPTAAANTNTTQVATTVTNSLSLKAPLASPTLTGTPTAPTAAVGTDTTQIATTAFVIDQIDASTQPGALYQTTAPTSPEIGQIWIDSDENVTTFDSNIIRRKTVTATAGQTVFTTDVPFIDGFEQVFMNGLLLVKTSDYTTSGGNTVTLTSGAAVSDIVEIVTVTGANSVSTYTQAETDALLAANTSVAPLSISANTTLVAKKRYFVTSASALTLTLPASPALNDEIQILDASGNASTYNITVARNGNKINGGTGNLIIDNNGGWYTLLYTGSTYGWKVG